MKRTIVAAVASTILAAGVLWAQEAKTKEEAQAQVDAGMAKSCEMAKTQVLAKKDVCAEEAAKLEPVDCTKRESRKTVDFLALNSSCSSKVRAASGKSAKSDKAGTTTSTKSTTAEAGKSSQPPAKASASHCKSLDEAGKVVAEAESTGGVLGCRGELREKLKKDHCAAGKVLKLSFVAVADGKDAKPSSFQVTCR